MVYIQRGLSKQDRAELIEFCEESAQYYKEYTHLNYEVLSDETLLDYAEYFEKKGYKWQGN